MMVCSFAHIYFIIAVAVNVTAQVDESSGGIIDSDLTWWQILLIAVASVMAVCCLCTVCANMIGSQKKGTTTSRSADS